MHHSLVKTAIVIPFTKAAFQQLQKDFVELTAQRKAVMERVRIAREMGDLSENGAYTYGKMELAATNRELARVRHLLQHGKIVEARSSDAVMFGSTVKLKSETGKELSYMLVSVHESNPTAGKLSTDSPFGQSLMGKKVGDQVEFEAPSGKKQFQVLAIA